MFGLCKHEWKVMVNERTRSPLEVIKNHGIHVSRGEAWMTEEKIVVILSCEKCGKINKSVTSNL